MTVNSGRSAGTFSRYGEWHPTPEQTETALGLGTSSASAVSNARDYAVLVSVAAQTAPAQITLNWPQNAFAEPTSYTVSRKAPTAMGWSVMATVPGAMTSFVDTAVALNSEYEYEVQKSAIGYALAGIEAPAAEFRGTTVLIVDSTFATDLAGGGWAVLRPAISRTHNPASVEALIRSQCWFGHVPVLATGDLASDGHPFD